MIGAINTRFEKAAHAISKEQHLATKRKSCGFSDKMRLKRLLFS